MKENKENSLVKTTALTFMISATLIISGGVTGIIRDKNESEDSLQTISSDDGCQPPCDDVYISCGEQDFCVVVENLGTYEEETTVLWLFYQYTTEKELIDTGSVDVALEAGAGEEVCLFIYTFNEEGVYEIEVEVISETDCNLDNNGPESLFVGADCCGPDSCFTLDPENPDGENNWFITPVYITAYAWDTFEVQSGIKEIIYIIDGEEDLIPGDYGIFVIDVDGIHFIEIHAVDNVGNEEDDHHTFEVAIDKTDPDLELIGDIYKKAGKKIFDITAITFDKTAGIDRVEFFIDYTIEGIDNSFPYEWTDEWKPEYKDKTFTAKAYDGAGNYDEADIHFDEISYEPQSQQQIQIHSQ